MSSRVRLLIVLGCCLLAVIVGLVLRAWMGTTTSVTDAPKLPTVNVKDLFAEVVEAIAIASQDVSENPTSSQAWGHLGRVFLAHEMLPQADECFQQAHLLDPRQVVWIYLRAVIHESTDPQLALTLFRDAYELTPGIPTVRSAYVDILLANGEFLLARRVLESASADGRSLYQGAMVAKLSGRWDEALELAREALQKNPQQRQIAELYVELLGRNHGPGSVNRQPSDELDTSALSSDWPDPYIAEVIRCRRDPFWVAALADQQASEGRFLAAESTVARLVELHPEIAEFHQQRIEYLIELGELKKANAAADAALRTFPNHPLLAIAQGVVSLQSGESERAREELDRAIQLKPDSATAYYYLGLVLIELRSPLEARQALEEACVLDPGLQDAVIALRKLKASMRDGA